MHSAPLVLHDDIGSSMKGTTIKTTMVKRGITAPCSRPRVSNDNSFSEALFRTYNYRPDWPNKGFATKDGAQAWLKSFTGWYNDEHCTAPSVSSHHKRATLAMILQPWPVVPVSMQMHGRKIHNTGQAISETGNPPDQSGLTQKPKSETLHEIGGQTPLCWSPI